MADQADVIQVFVERTDGNKRTAIEQRRFKGSEYFTLTSYYRRKDGSESDRSVSIDGDTAEWLAKQLPGFAKFFRRYQEKTAASKQNAAPQQRMAPTGFVLDGEDVTAEEGGSGDDEVF